MITVAPPADPAPPRIARGATGDDWVDRANQALARVSRVRAVLGGRDLTGQVAGPSMFDPDVISFAHGEGVRRPHPTVVAAGARALLDPHASSLESYLFLQRLDCLDEAIATRFESGGIPTTMARNIHLDTGTTSVFWSFIHTFTRPGDCFLVAPTFYHSLATWCALGGVDLQVVRTTRRSDFKFAADAIEDWIDAATTAGRRPPVGLFLFNPTQTGALYEAAELEAISEVACRRQLFIVEDCIFRDTCFDEQAIPPNIASVDGMAERTLTIDGVSKAQGLANLRVGWACGPEEVVAAMRFHGSATTVSVPHVAQLMALAALQAPPEYARANTQECEARAGIMARAAARLNAAVSEMAGEEVSVFEVGHVPRAGHSMLFLADALRGRQSARGPITDSVDLAAYYLQTARVAFSPGHTSGFDDCAFRATFGCVGLENTYGPTRPAELAAVLEELGRWVPGSVRPALAELAVEPADAQLAGADAGDWYTRGRELIEEAFERLLPATIALVRGDG